MTEIRSKLGVTALALALALGGLASAGCVDHSGDKTYPRVDAGMDTPVTEDDATTGGQDAPTTDDAASADAPAPTDTHADTAAGDTGNNDSGAPVDLRVDLGPG